MNTKKYIISFILILYYSQMIYASDLITKEIAQLNQGTLTSLLFSVEFEYCNKNEWYALINHVRNNNTGLKELHICDNFFNNDQKKDLISAVAENTHLSSLIVEIDIGLDDPSVLKNIMNGKTALTRLELHNNFLPDNCIQILSVMPFISSLTFLDLSNNEIGNSAYTDGANTFTSALCASKKLNTLILDNNEFIFAEDIAQLLITNTSLTKLSLRECFGPIKETKSIFDALKFNTTLTELHIGGSNYYLPPLNGLFENKTLLILDVHGSHSSLFSSNSDCGTIEDLIQYNKSITRLNLSAFDSLLSGDRIKDVLTENNTIVALDLSCLKLSKKESIILALIKGLENNSTISSLNMKHNNFDDHQIKALSDALYGNKKRSSGSYMEVIGSCGFAD